MLLLLRLIGGKNVKCYLFISFRFSLLGLLTQFQIGVIKSTENCL